MAVDSMTISAKFRTLAQKRWILAIAGGVLIGTTALIVTNPGKSAYVDYASERLLKELKQDCNEFEDDIEVGDVLTLPTRDLCRSFVGSADFIGRGAVKLVIDTSTERQNFGVFSIYTTELPGRTFKTIGIGRNFMLYN
ncbi:MAG: DUF4359 domain-containing protein [Cyanobacteria bacterium P01_A01_bin.123]